MVYDEKFVTGLEWLWGKGFLSPGGGEELAEILRNVSIQDKTVLDIGCGIGGIDRLMVVEHGAKKVVGIDVVELLIERARDDTDEAGLSGQIEYRLAEPGGLDFEDAAFDVVFTKDAIIHIQDKRAIYQEIYRVLRSGGLLVGSDWLGGDTSQQSELVRDWLDFSKLDFHFWTGSQMRHQLGEIGFDAVEIRDRNDWYRKAVRAEIDRISGDNRLEYIKLVGEELADKRLTSSELKKKVVDAGELRPTIFRAVKPSSG